MIKEYQSCELLRKNAVSNTNANHKPLRSHAIQHDLLVVLGSVLWMIWQLDMFVDSMDNTDGC